MERRISIRPVQGHLTHDCDTFTKMDPYIIFKIGSQTMKSTCHRGGGLKPTWSDIIYMSVSPQDKNMSITVMDKDTFKKDDVVGQGVIPLAKVMQQGKTNEWYEIKFLGRYAGRVNIQLEMVGHNPVTAFQHPLQAYPPNNIQAGGQAGNYGGYTPPAALNNFGMQSPAMAMGSPNQGFGNQGFGNQGFNNQGNQGGFAGLAANPGGFNLQNLFAGMAAATLTAQGMQGMNNAYGANQAAQMNGFGQAFNGQNFNAQANYPSPQQNYPQPQQQFQQPASPLGKQTNQYADAMLMMGMVSPMLANLAKKQSGNNGMGQPQGGGLPPGFLEAGQGAGFGGYR